MAGEKVFQVVDGRRVPKPGNERDPARRYSRVLDCSTGESYSLELTPEEEMVMDARSEKWESERPKREASERARIKEEEEFRSSLKYENRIVAFLDVLGWSDAITKSENDEDLVRTLGVCAKSLHVQQSAHYWIRECFGSDGPPGNAHVTQFSDCIVLSATPDQYGLEQIAWKLHSICDLMLRNGFLVRGAITVGKLLHRDQMCYGPALIEAYEAEKKIAYYPRVVVMPDLAGFVGQGTRYYDGCGMLLGSNKTWRSCSFDGRVFFDYLQPPLATTFSHPCPEYTRSHLQLARRVALNGLHIGKSNPHIYAKYIWFAKYVNEVIAEYPSVGVEMVDI